MSCLFYRQERTHIWFQRVPLNKFGQLGWDGWDLWGLLSLRFFIHTRKRPSNFYWNCNFSLLTHLTFIFFAVWSVSLSWEQSENNHFFSLQSENKNPHISLIFALSEYERRTLLPVPTLIYSICERLYISRIGLPIMLQGNMWTDPGNIPLRLSCAFSYRYGSAMLFHTVTAYLCFFTLLRLSCAFSHCCGSGVLFHTDTAHLKIIQKTYHTCMQKMLNMKPVTRPPSTAWVTGEGFASPCPEAQ